LPKILKNYEHVTNSRNVVMFSSILLVFSTLLSNNNGTDHKGTINYCKTYVKRVSCTWNDNIKEYSKEVTVQLGFIWLWRKVSVEFLQTRTHSWNRVFLEKLTCSQLVKKFTAFYRTRRFITTFTRARHLSLS